MKSNARKIFVTLKTLKALKILMALKAETAFAWPLRNRISIYLCELFCFNLINFFIYSKKKKKRGKSRNQEKK